MARLGILVVLTTLLSVETRGQCSDAGACVISRHAQSARHHIGLSYIFGASGKPDELTFHGLRFEGEFSLFENSRVAFEIPYSSQSGPLGKTSGFGDIIIVWNQSIYQRGSSAVIVHLGGKLTVGEVNSGNLPQAYQSTLGTNDILLGLTYNYSVWSASAVYQISRGRSENALTRLQRGNDLLVRAGYGFTIQPVMLIAELLAIKRLEESSVRNTGSGSPETYYNLPNSDQFQVNLQGRAVYPLREGFSLQLLAALPLLKRDVNVDGLKRSLSLSLGISHLF